MRDNHLRRTSQAPEGCQKRFEKTRSRMVYHAILGFGVHPNKRPMAIIGHRDIACRLSNMISESIAC